MINLKIEYFIALILATLLLSSCDPSGKRPSDMSPQELVKSREIKKVSDIDILKFAEKKGKELMMLIESQTAPLQKNNNLDSASFFDIYSRIKNDSTLLSYKTHLKLVSAYTSDKEGRPDPVEAQIIEAYQYNLQNQIPVSESIQLLDDQTQVLFTSPILINNQLVGIWSLKLPKKEIVSDMN